MELYILYFLVITLSGALAFVLYLLNKSTQVIDLYEEWMIMVRALSKKTYDAMHAVDARGAFEADDEIGDAFKMIKFLIEELDKRVSDEELKSPPESEN